MEVFKNQIGRNMEVYVDDMFVKSTEAQLHIDDLAEAFDALGRSLEVSEVAGPDSGGVENAGPWGCDVFGDL